MTDSNTPPTTSTPPPPAPAPPTDPRLAALRALFPNYDDLILSSVLDSVNGDQDRAIDALLGMSDPEYKAPPHAQAMSQTELDEQFARRLVLEEQDAWIARRAGAETEMPPQQQQQPRQHQQQESTDTMADIQQQFGKFAETGKKTFSTLFSKVKAKIQEMDQPKTSTSAYDPEQYEQRTAQNRPYVRAPRPRTQQPAYYDPNPRAASASPPLVRGHDTAGPAMQGYDTAPAGATQAAPAGTSGLDTSSTSTPPLNNDTPQRPLTSPPIDGGKYGLLPKRPVTLLRPGEPTQTQRRHSLDDSDDGLEYAESPFDDGRK